MVHKPARFLRHPDMLRQLNTGNALAGRRKQVNGDEPFFEWQFALAKDRPGLNGEILFAGSTTIPLAVAERINFLVAAVRTIRAVAETDNPHRR